MKMVEGNIRLNYFAGKGRLSCDQADAIKRDLQVRSLVLVGWLVGWLAGWLVDCYWFLLDSIAVGQCHINDDQQQDKEEVIEMWKRERKRKRETHFKATHIFFCLFITTDRLLAGTLTCSTKCSLSWSQDRLVAGSYHRIKRQHLYDHQANCHTLFDHL